MHKGAMRLMKCDRMCYYGIKQKHRYSMTIMWSYKCNVREQSNILSAFSISSGILFEHKTKLCLDITLEHVTYMTHTTWCRKITLSV